jgi:hypothetical protein
MEEDLYIASMMLCREPRVVGGYVMLSCSDSVWEPIRYVPEEIRPYFTDELGNKSIEYGGFLYTNDSHALTLLDKNQLYACFRGVSKNYLDVVDCPLAIPLADFSIKLKLVGWDIANGNGWVSASCDGVYPIDPFDGSQLDGNANQINGHGLFDNLKDCLSYCAVNDESFPARAPWYPVAIYLDLMSFDRLP